MSKKVKFFVGIAVVIVVAVFIIIRGNSDKMPITKDDGHEFVSNEILVNFRGDISKGRAEKIVEKIGGKIVERPFMDYNDSSHVLVRTKRKFRKYSKIKDFCKSLEETYPEIVSVECNYITHID